MIQPEVVATPGQGRFCVAALRVMGAHDGNDSVVVAARIDDFINFLGRPAGFHIEPVSVDSRELFGRHAGQAEAREAVVGGFAAVKHQAAGAPSDNVIDMAGDAVCVHRHQLDFYRFVVVAERLINDGVDLVDGL